MKKVSIVILNWNGAAMLRRFLPTVVAHSADIAEIVVADIFGQLNRDTEE